MAAALRYVAEGAGVLFFSWIPTGRVAPLLSEVKRRVIKGDQGVRALIRLISLLQWNDEIRL